MDPQLRRKHPTITQDPAIMVGKPTLNGTRLTVEAVVRMVAAEGSVQQAADAYRIRLEDVKAALYYAADHVRSPYKLVDEDAWDGDAWEEVVVTAAE